MKITIPENIADITLEQFQKYSELINREEVSDDKKAKRKIQIFCGLKPNEIELMAKKDYDEVNSMIDLALEKEANFINTFTLDGIAFGFIPNFDKITLAEYSDLQKYGAETETLHNLMAILFRPITDKNKRGEYIIEDYRGTERYAEVMKQTPLNIVNGALFFFINLSLELVSFTQRYTVQGRAKANKRVTTS